MNLFVFQLFDLRERSFGRLEGQPAERWREIDAWFYAEDGSLTFAERVTKQYGDGIYTDQELLDHVASAVHAIAVTNEGKTILFCTHGGPIRICS